MSLDYTNILPKELKSVERFKKWMEFWHLGNVAHGNDVIQRILDKVLLDIRNRSALLTQLNSVKERLDDIVHYISNEDLKTDNLYGHILKLDKDFSAFKSRVIIDEDTFFGMVLSELESIRDRSSVETVA